MVDCSDFEVLSMSESHLNVSQTFSNADTVYQNNLDDLTHKLDMLSQSCSTPVSLCFFKTNKDPNKTEKLKKAITDLKA